MLRMDQLETGYGKKQVLFGLSLEVQAGETVGIIGPNGSGKSTTLKAVCGLIQPWAGEINFEGAVLNGATPAPNVRRGITLAPQGDRVFSDLSAMENLEIGGYTLPKTGSARQDRLRVGDVPGLARAGEAGGGKTIRRRTADAGPGPSPDPQTQASHAG